MDLERAMEFILEQHARTEAVLAELGIAQKETDARLAELAAGQKAADRRTDRLERNLARLANLGMRARNGLNRRADDLERRSEEHDRWMAEQKLVLAEIGDKLNALIGFVDRQQRHPPA